MSRPPICRAVLFAALLAGAAVPAIADQRWSEQGVAKRERERGALSLEQIEARIVPRMRGCDYLGPEIDAATNSYRLKFMRNGNLFWIDVDQRTGAVIGRSGY